MFHEGIEQILYQILLVLALGSFSRLEWQDSRAYLHPQSLLELRLHRHLHPYWYPVSE